MADANRIALLQNVDLFSSLKLEELSTVAEYSEYREIEQGVDIFTEGSPSEQLYIIKSGEVVITKRSASADDEGKRVDIARFVEGDCFGELGMLDNSPRNETATATRTTTLLVFPQRSLKFQELLQKHPAVFARILHTLLAKIAGRIRSTNALISENAPWVQDLRRQLLSDELTGLYNRVFLDEELPKLLPTYGAETAFVMFKPDQFKLINDNYGHEAGDEVLKLLAETVKSNLRPDDVGIRYRGNEIGVVFPNTGRDGALPVAERIRSAVSALDISHITNGTKLEVTVSVGLASYPRDAGDDKRLVERAFEKMFEARESGGNRINVADEGPA